MKKCPFCAEEIQDEAIKCRYCGSFLSAAPGGGNPPARDRGGPAPGFEAGQPSPGMSPALRPAAPAAAGSVRASQPEGSRRRVLYAGSPSWRAYFKAYVLVILFTVVGPIAGLWAAAALEASSFTRFLAVAVPVVLGAIAIAVVSLYRRSRIVRVTTTNIETEYGFLSKKIDVIELWRCRDVRYKQSLFDRILRIAHIDVYTADVTTPNLCIVGLPASRELFEGIRDSIEIQRQARNVVGFVQ